MRKPSSVISAMVGRCKASGPPPMWVCPKVCAPTVGSRRETWFRMQGVRNQRVGCASERHLFTPGSEGFESFSTLSAVGSPSFRSILTYTTYIIINAPCITFIFNGNLKIIIISLFKFLADLAQNSSIDRIT